MYDVNGPPSGDLANRIAARSNDETEWRKIMAGRPGLYYINPYRLKVHTGFNARNFDDIETAAHITGLAESIKEIGVKRPLHAHVENETIWIYDGECRLRGTRKAIEIHNAEIMTVPVMISERGLSEADRVASLVTHNSGKPLKPLEQGSVFKRLRAYGWQTPEIARQVGVKAQTVDRLVEMQSLPEPVKLLISEGLMEVSLAYQIMKDNRGSPEKTIAAVEAAIENARSNGKKKATPRFAQVKRQNIKKDMTAILGSAFVEIFTDDDTTEEAIISMPREQWERIKTMLGIETKG